MRAVVCRDYGTPEDLVVDELPDPTPGPGQVVVRVRAAAVNYPDVLLIAGKYQIKVPPPFSPGSEMAGEVLAVGDGVDVSPGDRVSATTFVGAFAEQALVDARGLTRIPDGVDYADAAAFRRVFRRYAGESPRRRRSPAGGRAARCGHGAERGPHHRAERCVGAFLHGPPPRAQG